MDFARFSGILCGAGLSLHYGSGRQGCGAPYFACFNSNDNCYENGLFIPYGTSTATTSINTAIIATDTIAGDIFSDI